MNQHIDYLRRTPPRCISVLASSRIHYTLRDHLARRLGESDFTYFGLCCPCGCASGELIGYSTIGSYGGAIFVSPLAFRCARCQLETAVIDTREHGHDGEFGYDCTIAAQGTREAARCPRCKSTLLQTAVMFGYQYGVDDWPDCEGRFEDFFDVFAAAGRCMQCAEVFDITEFECA